jgi:hypothetical protein
MHYSMGDTYDERYQKYVDSHKAHNANLAPAV